MVVLVFLKDCIWVYKRGNLSWLKSKGGARRHLWLLKISVCWGRKSAVLSRGSETDWRNIPSPTPPLTSECSLPFHFSQGHYFFSLRLIANISVIDKWMSDNAEKIFQDTGEVASSAIEIIEGKEVFCCKVSKHSSLWTVLWSQGRAGQAKGARREGYEEVGTMGLVYAQKTEVTIFVRSQQHYFY